MKEILLVDKPKDWTSFDVVAKIRGKIRSEIKNKGEKPTKRQLKVGHAGTLDPFATGLLVILLGDACKKAGEYLKLDKTYEFTAKLGEVSTTGDPEGDIESVSSNVPDLVTVEEVVSQFQGDIMQVPPAFSAIKIDGKRAYKLAREGKEVEIPARQVRVDKIEVISYEYPLIKVVCDVGSGTYIRSLVEDIGRILETGAYCTELRRTRIGDYLVENAQTVEEITNNLQFKED